MRPNGRVWAARVPFAVMAPEFVVASVHAGPIRSAGPRNVPRSRRQAPAWFSGRESEMNSDSLSTNQSLARRANVASCASSMSPRGTGDAYSAAPGCCGAATVLSSRASPDFSPDRV